MEALDGNIRFATPQDEINYWRNKAEQIQKELQVVREEYLEFHASSKDLEEELDTTIKQLDKEKKDFSLMNNRLQEEVDSLKKKLESVQTAWHYEVSKLQTEVCGYKAWKEENQKYIIRIEQLNDDLERQNRITALSLSDFEKNLNMALERNVLLENELDGKEIMREAIQRLKDEARDLRSELKAKGMKRMSSSTENSSTSDIPSSSGIESAAVTTAPSSTDSSRTPSAMSSDSSVHPNTGDSTNCTATPPPSTAATTVSKGTTLSPAARISALSIVGDLLQKVGALETKLASCRNFGAGGDQTHSGLVASGSPINSPRSVLSHHGGCRGSSRLKAGTAQQRAPLNVTM